MNNTKTCIFTCGGHGTRMGADVPKQFLTVGGKTILQHTMEHLLAFDSDLRCIVVLPSEFIEFWKKECFRTGFIARQKIIQGGMTRFHSVRNALEVVGKGETVAVHDGVRPFVSPALAGTLYSETEKWNSAVPVIPVVDTVKVLQAGADGNLVRIQGKTADRSELFCAQTPQVFEAELLKDAYCRPYDTSYTDDASVVEASGVEIHYVPGERYNIKITTPEDMSLAGRLLL